MKFALISLLALLVPCAFALAQTAPKADPPKTLPETEKALELFKQEKIGDAVELLAKAGKTNLNLPPPKVQIAQWYLQANKGQNARIMTEQAIAEDNRHPECYLWNANIAYNEGRVTDATLNLSMALLLTDDKRWDADQKKRFAREARYGLASCYESRADFSSAKEQIIGLLNDDAKNAGLRQRLATILFRQDSVEEARKELAQAFADDSTTDPPELRLAALWQLKSNGEADSKKAVEARDKAEEWFKKAATAHPKNAKCFREYALWLLDANKVDAALLYIDQAVQLDAGNKDNLSAKGLYQLYKDYAAAEASFETLYKESPNNLFAMANLCLSLAESKDEKKRKRAGDLADALVKQYPRAPVAYSIAGWCQYRQGKLDEAEKALAQSASVGQVSYDTAYFMACVLRDRQKFAEAVSILKPAIEAAHGPFIYRAEAKVLLPEIAAKIPEKKDPPKSP